MTGLASSAVQGTPEVPAIRLPGNPAGRAPADELRVLKQYSERLVLKLEERNIELETAQESLAGHQHVEQD